MRLEERVQLIQHLRFDLGMRPPLAVSQTPFSPVLQHAVETLRPVESEVVAGQLVLDLEECLDASQLRDRVPDEVVAVDETESLQREPAQPVRHVAVVERATDGIVRLTHLACGAIYDELLEGVVRPPPHQLVAVDLSVVGDDALHGVA